MSEISVSAATGTTALAHRRRIGLILAGLAPAEAIPSEFLLLQMNKLQNTFEYEVMASLKPGDTPDLLRKLQGKARIARREVREQIPDFVQRYRAEIDRLNGDYNLREPPPDYFIVICMACFDDDYYTTRQGPGAVIALGNWEREMAPPTLAEFMLTLVVREAVASLSATLRGSVHFGTKGCICDFTYDLSHVRYKVLIGYVCAHCRAALSNDGLPHVAGEVEHILAKRWLIQANDATTPSAILAKLGHHLFITKGLQPTRAEKLRAILEEEGAKQLMNVVFIVLVALGSAALGALGVKIFGDKSSFDSAAPGAYLAAGAHEEVLHP